VSILIDQKTKLIIQGITGREGTFHAKLMQEYGTKVVAGVTPDSGIKLVVTIAEGVPFHDMLFCYTYARLKNCTLIGPNTPGIISPAKSKVGFMDSTIYKKGNIGIMSRSATLSYETVNNLSNNGIGQSTVVGIGGDPIQGSSFVDLLPLFEKDSETDLIIIIGEIGGADEEIAAEYIKKNITKPVIAFIAGEAAPEGKRMGHAGAIIGADGVGSAKHKKEVLKDAGVYIVERLDKIAETVLQIPKKRGDFRNGNIN